MKKKAKVRNDYPVMILISAKLAKQTKALGLRFAPTLRQALISIVAKETARRARIS